MKTQLFNLKSIHLVLLSILILYGCSGEEELKYNLKVLTSIKDGGIVNPTLGSYVPGTNVSVTATPAEYYFFKEWEGDAKGETNPLTLVMDSNKSITAIFDLKDTDMDGITDDIDECPETRFLPVDENGCTLILLPDVTVNKTIFLNNPEFIDLQVVGGWAYSTGGISGIIIYHSGINNYLAFERSAPHLTPQDCSKMVVKNSMTMECACDNSIFSILNGAPLTDGVNYPAKQYKVLITGPNTLQITNF